MNHATPPWEDDDDLPPVDSYINDRTKPSRTAAATATSTRPGDALHTVQGYIMRQTEKAILIEVWQVNGKDIPCPDQIPNRNMWFPLSQVSTIHTAPPGNADAAMEYDYIRAKEWILKQKDLL